MYCKTTAPAQGKTSNLVYHTHHPRTGYFAIIIQKKAIILKNLNHYWSETQLNLLHFLSNCFALLADSGSRVGEKKKERKNGCCQLLTGCPNNLYLRLASFQTRFFTTILQRDQWKIPSWGREHIWWTTSTLWSTCCVWQRVLKPTSAPYLHSRSDHASKEFPMISKHQLQPFLSSWKWCSSPHRITIFTPTYLAEGLEKIIIMISTHSKGKWKFSSHAPCSSIFGQYSIFSSLYFCLLTVCCSICLWGDLSFLFFWCKSSRSV